MSYLDIQVLTHMPDRKDGRHKTVRSKGKVERPIRSVKDSPETFYHLHPLRAVYLRPMNGYVIIRAL